MKFTAITALALIGASFAAPAFAADKHAKPTVVASLPVCTGASSLFDVLGDKCHLVKGSMIYGDIADLSGITDSLSGVASVGGAISAP